MTSHTTGGGHVALESCMIDGFGSFEEADYRRSWLFFHQVDYILPVEVAGPLEMPANLDSRPDFRVARPELSAEEQRRLVELARQDAMDPAFRSRVLALVPRSDL